MKNNICKQQEIKIQIINIKIYIYIIIFIFSSNIAFSQTLYIRNGSFEKHVDMKYPNNLTKNHGDFGPGYLYSQLNRCIGFCSDTAKWPPTEQPSGCANNINNQPSLDGGWYFPSNCGSSDYYHVAGLEGAKVPRVNTTTLNDNNRYEYRYPYGCIEGVTEQSDSAFIGIRLIVENSDLDDVRDTYKEYVQSKLDPPLIGSNVYVVKFYVSKSKYSRSIMNLGALFTTEAPLTPDKDHFYNTFWEWNLIDINYPYPYKYYDNPQIHSRVRLDQQANAAGFGGWQEIKDTLVVPAGVVYNYITLGNFQSDEDLWNDVRPKINENEYIELYYFIDNISIENLYPAQCMCMSSYVVFNSEKNLTTSDSSHCCYDFSLHFPPVNSYPTAPSCSYTRFKIMKDTVTIKDTSAANNQTFNSHTIYSSFCVDKFPSYNNEFTIYFYSKDSHGNEYLLDHCTQRVFLNCVCDCSNLTNFPYPKNKMKFNLVKVDESASGICCWDLKMINPLSHDDQSCEYDLSGLWALLRSDVPGQDGDIHNIQGYGDEFRFVRMGDRFSWQAPTPLIIKPGEQVTIGRICTYGTLPENNKIIPLSLIISNDSVFAQGCTTVLSTKISCDSASIDSVANCCDYWELQLSQVNSSENMPNETPSINAIWKDYNLSLKHKNTPDFCNNGDTLSILVTFTGSTFTIRNEFALSNLISNEINLKSFIALSDTSHACITIVNKRTHDTCIKCVDITPFMGMTKKNNDVLLKSKSYLDNHPDEFFDVVPNPIENKFDIIFRSDNVENCTATLNDNLGNLLMSNNFRSQKGVNRITFSNINFNSGMYFINLNIAGKLYSKKVLILK